MSNAGDPLLKGASWRAVVTYWRGELKRRPLHCERCGGPIAKPGKTRGPDSLDVGHIVSRVEARAMGWTEQQINALSNTRPEHARCNRSDGARLGNQARRVTPPRAPLTSEAW